MSHTNTNQALSEWRDIFIDEVGHVPTMEELIEFLDNYDHDLVEPNETLEEE